MEQKTRWILIWDWFVISVEVSHWVMVNKSLHFASCGLWFTHSEDGQFRMICSDFDIRCSKNESFLWDSDFVQTFMESWCPTNNWWMNLWHVYLDFRTQFLVVIPLVWDSSCLYLSRIPNKDGDHLTGPSSDIKLKLEALWIAAIRQPKLKVYTSSHSRNTKYIHIIYCISCHRTVR